MASRWCRPGDVAVMLAAAIAGCGGPMVERPGRVAVHLTDAPGRPGALRRVELFIVRIDARLKEASPAELRHGLEDDAAGRDGWVTLSEPKQPLDVLSLRGGTLAMIGEAALEPGDYRALRLVIQPGRSRVVLRGGHVLDLARALVLPDSARKAIDVPLDRPLRVEPGVTTELVIDFDLARSLQVDAEGARREIRFTPVIRAAGRAAPASRLSQSRTTNDPVR